MHRLDLNGFAENRRGFAGHAIRYHEALRHLAAGTALDDARFHAGLARAHGETPKQVRGSYRYGAMCVPDGISACPGICVNGRLLKSFVFTTDLVTVRNCNADAILAVYPYTCQPAITQALLMAAECPVFTGVAGTTTGGQRSVDLAVTSEMQGVAGVVLNVPASPETISAVASRVDAIVVVTVTSCSDGECERIDAGAQIVNVAAGRDTPYVVSRVRAAFPSLPILASGGKDAVSIATTIAAGADAITWTPPSVAELEQSLMNTRRADSEQSGVEESQSA